MEVIVYFSVDKPLFKRVVMCPDALDVKAFVNACKAIFGNDCIVDILFT